MLRHIVLLPVYVLYFLLGTVTCACALPFLALSAVLNKSEDSGPRTFRYRLPANAEMEI